jgi:hypothetical protein
MRAPLQKRRSDSETLATLRAAAGQHLTASTSGHARTEAVGTLTVNFARLISTLHAGISTGKGALKQVHARALRGAARVRTTPDSVKHTQRVGA